MELIFDKARALPPELQEETLHYIDSLLARPAAAAATREWTRFSREQLASHYAPEDAAYDTD
ncbi:MAG: hypothetical protein EXS37_06405 [Opitutus sp.]|nr:hypothetical protein [Opitutus sp.]